MKRNWYIGQIGCTAVDKFKAEKIDPKAQCDEFPMLTTNRGGPSNHPGFVSLRYVNGPQNGSAGKLWELLAAASKMKSDPKKQAIVVGSTEIPFSFYIPD